MEDRLFKYILLSIAFVYAIHTNAQEKNDHIEDNSEKNMVEFHYRLNNSLSPIFNNQSENSIFDQTNQSLKINYNNFSTKNINWKIIDNHAYNREVMRNYFKPMFNSNYKHIDYMSSGVDAEKFNFFSISYDANYGFEGATLLGLGMQWQATDKLTVTTNPFITSYFLPFDVNRRLSAGLNTMMTYQANDWLIMRLHGQYAINGTKKTDALLAPQNSFGGDAIIKFSQNFGIGGGVRYINHAGKWTPQYYPVIHINAKKRNSLK